MWIQWDDCPVFVLKTVHSLLFKGRVKTKLGQKGHLFTGTSVGYITKGHFLGDTRQKNRSSAQTRGFGFQLLHDEGFLTQKLRAIGVREDCCEDCCIPNPCHHQYHEQKEKGRRCRMTLIVDWSCLEKVKDLSGVLPLSFFLLNVVSCCLCLPKN